MKATLNCWTLDSNLYDINLEFLYDSYDVKCMHDGSRKWQLSSAVLMLHCCFFRRQHANNKCWNTPPKHWQRYLTTFLNTMNFWWNFCLRFPIYLPIAMTNNNKTLTLAWFLFLLAKYQSPYFYIAPLRWNFNVKSMKLLLALISQKWSMTHKEKKENYFYQTFYCWLERRSFGVMSASAYQLW